MISRLSYIITDYLYSKGNIKESEKEVYHYGYVLVLDGILDTIVLVLLGLILNKLPEALLFILVFTSLRVCAGGYHAGTRLRCVAITFGSCLLSIEFSGLILDLFNERLFYPIAIIFVYIVFFLLAPIENSKKPIDENNIIRLKTKSLMLLSIYVIITFVTYYFHFFSNVMIITLIEVALLMVVGYVSQRRTKK